MDKIEANIANYNFVVVVVSVSAGDDQEPRAGAPESAGRGGEPSR